MSHPSGDAEAVGTHASDQPYTRALSPPRPKGQALNDEAIGSSASSRLGFTAALNTALLCGAIRQGDYQLTSHLLSYGCDPNCRDEDGSTPLHLAAVLGLTRIIATLAQAGGNIEARAGAQQSTPLLQAAEHGQTAAAISLLDLGANANALDSSGTTALELAASGNNIRLLIALIKRGAVVDARSGVNGWTALQCAAGFNRPAAISALVRFGADVNNRDNVGDTPLMTACSLGHIDCVQQLLAGGADPSLQTLVRHCDS